MNKCRVCGNTNSNKEFKVREMMFGTREEFSYFECNYCRSILISDIPNNIEKYYPSNYYSFNDNISAQKTNLLKKLLRNILGIFYMNEVFGNLLNGWIERKNFIYLKILKTAGCQFNYKILDIGSGVGAKLSKLPDFGFKKITGSDPYIDKDVFYKNGLKILRKSIFEIYDKFDFIMFNHSFEHMPNPDHVLNKLNSLLDLNSLCMIRIPVADSYAWKYYHENWVALDAPRHFTLFSPNGFELFVKKFGFEVVRVTFESSEYQFLGSEQYKNDIPLLAENSFYTNFHKSIFTQEQTNNFKNHAKLLNQNKQGDVACFYIKKVCSTNNE